MAVPRSRIAKMIATAMPALEMPPPSPLGLAFDGAGDVADGAAGVVEELVEIERELEEVVSAEVVDEAFKDEGVNAETDARVDVEKVVRDAVAVGLVAVVLGVLGLDVWATVGSAWDITVLGTSALL